MKSKILLLLFLGYTLSNFAQSVSDPAVQVEAIAQSSPAKIILTWPTNGSTTQYQVFRKLKSGFSWGAAIATLGGAASSYTDATALVGVNYEYRITRTGSGYSGYGYINAGIEVEPIEYRGKLIMMVDSSIMPTLTNEIERYIRDVEGDGWEVIRHDVERSASVLHVKDFILNDFISDSTELKAVFLFGHVPVPYSGNINPDGHGDHLGAWPADVYYGDVDGIWTDLNVTSTTASPARTQNIPGDGKFDQSLVPGNVELQVGRVDFANMNTFTLTEVQMLKNYLDKDHNYRKKIYSPIKQAVVDDNFGYFGSEAFAASGYKNFGPLVGSANTTAADYFTSLSTTSYLWSYGCGGGTYTSAGGIGTTANFASSNLQGVFTMLFGSYFGDWDANNSFLRAPLATGMGLTSVWSGRPHYQFHHVGLGENIGYGLLLTQNNPAGLYFASPTGITGKWIHNALMGDPTLRNDVVSQVSSIVATKVGFDCDISWSASTQTNVIGYHLYVKNDSNTHYQRLNQLPIAGTTYTDNCLLYKGTYTYMVRAIVLENTNSGSYYNLSEGIADTAYNSSTIKTYALFTSTLSGATLSLTNTSINGTSVSWNFGGAQTSILSNPVQTFTSNGSYSVTLISYNACHSDTAYEEFTIEEVGLRKHYDEKSFDIFPNPSDGSVTLISSQAKEYVLILSDAKGQVVLKNQIKEQNVEINLRALKSGIYFVQLLTEQGVFYKKLVLN